MAQQYYMDGWTSRSIMIYSYAKLYELRDIVMMLNRLGAIDSNIAYTATDQMWYSHYIEWGGDRI